MNGNKNPHAKLMSGGQPEYPTKGPSRRRNPKCYEPPQESYERLMSSRMITSLREYTYVPQGSGIVYMTIVARCCT